MAGTVRHRAMRIIGLSWLGVMAGWSVAYGQLSPADIAALKERGAKEGWTFTVGANPATQHPRQELCGLVEPPDWRKNARFTTPKLRSSGLPPTFDWRTLGGCTPVKNQLGCGACWAFSAVGARECNIKIKDGVEEALSEQWLVSCTDGGCYGGFYGNSFQYFQGTWSDPCGGNGASLVPIELPAFPIREMHPVVARIRITIGSLRMVSLAVMWIPSSKP